MSLLYRFKPAKDRVLRPVSRALSSAGVTPNVVTATGLLVSVAAGLITASGDLGPGIVVFSVGACLDAVDGSLARFSGPCTEFGRYFDSVCDRLSEVAFTAGAIAGGVSSVAGAVVAGSVLLLAARIHNHAKGLDSDAAAFGRPERLALLVAGMLLPYPGNVVAFGVNALLCVVSTGQVLASGVKAENRL